MWNSLYSLDATHLTLSPQLRGAGLRQLEHQVPRPLDGPGGENHLHYTLSRSPCITVSPYLHATFNPGFGTGLHHNSARTESSNPLLPGPEIWKIARNMAAPSLPLPPSPGQTQVLEWLMVCLPPNSSQTRHHDAPCCIHIAPQRTILHGAPHCLVHDDALWCRAHDVAPWCMVRHRLVLWLHGM